MTLSEVKKGQVDYSKKSVGKKDATSQKTKDLENTAGMPPNNNTCSGGASRKLTFSQSSLSRR